MSEKKCRMCGDAAEWEWDSDFYCEYCLCIELDIEEVDIPRRCEQCGTLIKGSYFTEDGNAFCSRECAFEYNDAKKLKEEEQEGDDE